MNISKKCIYFLFSISPYLLTANTPKSRDLWFLPGHGNFQASVDTAYLASSTDFDFSGTPKLQDRSFHFAPSLSYGLTEELYLSGGVSFESGKSEELTSTTSKESTTASGINDPGVGLYYRILKQEESNAFLDAFLEYSPSIGKKKSSNVLRGSHEVSGGMKIGQLREAVEYSFDFDVSYYTDQKFSSGKTIKSHVDYKFGANFQYDFNELVSLNTKFDLAFLGDLKSNVTEEDTVNFDVAYTLIVGPAFQILDNLSADVALTYGKITGEWGVDFDATVFAVSGGLDYVF